MFDASVSIYFIFICLLSNITKFGNFYFLVPNYPPEKIPYLDTFHTVLLISEDTSVLTAQLK